MLMMTCEEARGATVLAAYGELETHRQGALRAHLIACAECAAQARDVRGAREIVALAEGHAIPESPLAGPPHAEIPVVAAMPARKRGAFALPWAVAAAILLAVAVSFLRPDRPTTAHAESVVASGAIAAGASEPLAGDTFEDEIESLQTELTSLESKVGEF